MRKRPPNFLFFITDQQRADHLGCYGNPVLKTPHIDAIAKQGTRFDKFYVATPLCQPNRNTIMTGRMPTLHGTRQNGIPLALDAVCFTHLLRQAGYRTGLFGKAHFQNFTGQAARFKLQYPQGTQPPPDEMREATRGLRLGAAYDRELNSQICADPAADEATGDFYGFERFRICTWHGDDVQGHYTHWLNNRLPGAKDLRSSVNPQPAPGYDAPQVRWSRIPPELYPTSYVAQETMAYLDERAESPDEPFFIQCSFPDPHHPFTPPGAYFHRYKPDDILLPASFHHTPHNQTPVLARLHEDFAAGTADRSWVAPYAVNAEEAKQITAVTYGMISMVDDAIGRVLEHLKTLGLDQDTVVIFTSDHGDWMGDHGIMQKGPLHYQGLIRVPFIWADPARPAASEVSSELAGSLDIARTVLMRAGLAPANGMQGQNLLDILHAGGRSTHDGILIEGQTSRPYLGMPHQVRIRTFCDARWRMTLWEGLPFGELYDLQNDPGEIVNLWDSTSHQTQRARLFERLAWKMIDLQDRSPFQVAEA